MKSNRRASKGDRRLIQDHVNYFGNYCPGAHERNHKPHYLEPDDYLTIDHILPIGQFGTNSRANKRILCNSENLAKGSDYIRTDDDLRLARITALRPEPHDRLRQS